jgi:uncharacterized damage-inducible protein DinB
MLPAMAIPVSVWNPICMSMLPEPWLRGPIAGVHPLVAPVLYAFEQAREDLARATADLTAAEIWASPHGFGSVGFHIAHIAGSTERLMSYLEGRALTEAQLAALRTELALGGIARDQLLETLDRVFGEAGKVVRAIDPATLAEPRAVGRQRLPTTVIGLLTHIAEHTQRHTGQAIGAAKWMVALRHPPPPIR